MRLREGRCRKLLPVVGQLCTGLPRRQLSIYPLPILLPKPPHGDAGDGTGYAPIAHLGKQSENLLQQPDRARAAGDSPWNAVERMLGQEPETSILSPVLSLAVLAFLGLSMPISGCLQDRGWAVGGADLPPSNLTSSAPQRLEHLSPPKRRLCLCLLVGR